MEKVFYLLASTEATEGASEGLFGALGIDWKILIFQAIAFCILVFILTKWVFPPILAMFDRRQKLIDDSVKVAKEATNQAEKAAAEVAVRLKEARDEADDIVALARKQSQQILIDAEGEADKRVKAAVASARQQSERDMEAVRKALRDEVVDLVVLATEKVIGAKVDPTRDAKLIDDAISQAEKGQIETTAIAQRQANALLRDTEAAAALKERGHLVASVTSARKLNAEERAELVKMLKQETKAKTVELKETVDESLVGGVIVHTPDAELDASLRARLARLKTI